MALNDGQQKAFEEIIDFLNSKRKYHNLEGGPGTGKSYLISHVLLSLRRYLKPGNTIRDFKVTATTNKAVSVLQNDLPSTAPPAQTIYSFMNLRVHNNYQTGDSKCVPTAKWVIHDQTFIVIDESSMVDKSLMKYINQGTTDNCKILFVGDADQLAPVKEIISEVYSSGHHSSTLTESVRNSTQPALQALNTQLRETVRTGIFKPIQHISGVIERVDGPMLKGIMEREYHKEDASRRILCYTNKKVQSYNKYIRKLRGYVKPYEIGEILLNNQSAEMTDKTRLYTDQEVKVVSIGATKMQSGLVKDNTFETQELILEDVHHGTSYCVNVFTNLQDREDVMRFHRLKKNWSTFFNIRDNYPDLRSAGATTTHKGQGSTYDSVIVDLDDIGTCTQKDQTARMMYVAGSRPKFKIYIKGELPERFYK